MNTIDIIIGGIIAFGTIKGFSKGMLSEVASLLSLILGIYGAFYFSDVIRNLLIGKTDWTENVINTLSYVLTFVLIVLTITAISKVLTKIIKLASLGLLNRFLGGLFGGLKMAFLLGIGLMFFHKINNLFSFVDESYLEDSILYYQVMEISSFIYDKTLQHQNFI